MFRLFASNDWIKSAYQFSAFDQLAMLSDCELIVGW